MDKWLATRARHRAGWSAALAALVLVGCGGGGGGEAQPVPVVEPVVPTAEISNVALETSSQPVLAATTDIDDSGRVAVLFAQNVGGRVALQAVQGEPGAKGVAPVFNQPVVIDALAPYNGSGQLGLAMSPVGHALAMWSSSAPCTASTYNTSGHCVFVYTARRLAGGSWEPPVLVGDTPAALPKAIINDIGDVALLWQTWRRDPQGALSLTGGVVWKAAAANQFSVPIAFDDIQTPAGTDVGFSLDRLGNMVYVSLAAGPASQMVVARRGSLAAGFGQTERLDDLAANAQIEGIWGGVNGQVVVLWQQQAGNGQTLRWSATLDGASQAWQISDRGAPRGNLRAGAVKAGVSNAGDFFRYDLENCTVLRRTAGTWQAETALPAGLCPSSTNFVQAVSRTGDLVGGLFNPAAVAGNTGQWLAYDATPGVLLQALGSEPGAYLFGTPSTVGGSMLLSENGIAAFVTGNNYDSLPSATAPAGTLGNVANLWVVYLKLP